MLVDQNDSNVLAVFCEAVECLLDCLVGRLLVYDEIILLGVGSWRDVLAAVSFGSACSKQGVVRSQESIWGWYHIHLYQREVGQ